MEKIATVTFIFQKTVVEEQNLNDIKFKLMTLAICFFFFFFNLVCFDIAYLVVIRLRLNSYKMFLHHVYISNFPGDVRCVSSAAFKALIGFCYDMVQSGPHCLLIG